MPEFDLQACLEPTTPERFFADFWERQPLCIGRSEERYFEPLLSLGNFDALLRNCALQPRRLSLSSFTAAAIASPVRGDGSLDVAKAHAAHHAGATLRVAAADQLWLPLAFLGRHLDAAFGAPVSVDAQLTPAGLQGRAAHYQSFDLLLLQVTGQSRVRLYHQAAEQPMADLEGRVDLKSLEAPTAEHTVAAGDTLYLPRGRVHELQAGDHPSLMLLVGIQVHRWGDLLQGWVDRIRRQPSLRRTLPPGAVLGQGDPAELQATWRDLLNTLAESAAITPLLRNMRHQMLEAMPILPDETFGQTTPLEPSTPVRHRRGVFCYCELAGAGNDAVVHLGFPGNVVSGPAFLEPPLRYIADARSPFTASDLPGDLDEDSKILLIQRLIDDGALVLVL